MENTGQRANSAVAESAKRTVPDGSATKPRAGKGLASLAFLLFLLLSTSIYVFLIFRDHRSLAAILKEIDAAQRSPSAAEWPLYQSAVKKADSEQDYLRIFKRIYQIKQNPVRSRYMLEISEKAVAGFPADENLWAYRVSALLDAGLFAQAIAASVHLQSERYLPLRGEIFVRSLSETRKKDRDAAEEIGIHQLVNVSPYSAAIYVSLARLFREPRFAWNGALLYMLQGNTEKALALVRELQNESWLNTLGAGLIAYDSQDWNLAVKLLERQLHKESQNRGLDTKTLQYLGDSYAYLGDYEKVAEILGQVEENKALDRDAANDSWQLYYNLASAYKKLGYRDRAFALLRGVLDRFPYSGEILLLLNMVVPPEEREYARNILNEFVATSSDNEPYLALAALVFANDGNMDQRTFESRLWQLFSNFPKNEPIFRYLLWYNIGLAHTGHIDLALERYQNLVLGDKPSGAADNFPAWILEYAGISALLDRNIERAQQIFESLPKANSADSKDWQTYYNIANMYVYQTDFAAAVKTLRKALEMAESEREKVHIYYRIVVIGEGTRQNYLPDSAELDQILRSYIESNYRYNQDRKAEDDLFHAKLDSLILWRKAAGSDLLDEPEQYRAGQSPVEDEAVLSLRPAISSR